MWKIIYNLASFFLFIPYCIYVSISGKTRGSLAERIFPRFKGDVEKIWIHAASLGEASLSLLLVKFLKQERPELEFVLTANTNYAREYLKNNLNNYEILPSPIDTNFVIKRFLRKGRIKSLILIETEIWPNMIWESKKNGTKVILVNGRLSEKALRNYRIFKFFMREVLREIDHILSQSPRDRERFIELGADPERIRILGNMKYLAYEVKDEVPKERFITFGSVREKEIPGVIGLIIDLSKKYGDLKFILAPREKNQFSKVFDKMKKEIETQRYSVVKEIGFGKERVIVVDTFGDLRDLYARSLLSFVGGSLYPYGGHNPLEPLIYGTPVLFGPHVENFKEICSEIIRSGAGFMVRDVNELRKRIEELVENDVLRKDMGNRGKRMLEEKRREVESRLKELVQIV